MQQLTFKIGLHLGIKSNPLPLYLKFPSAWRHWVVLGGETTCFGWKETDCSIYIVRVWSKQKFHLKHRRLLDFSDTSKNPSQMFFKIGVLKKFAILQGKHLCWSHLLINFIKIRLQCSCFSGNNAKFLKTPFLQNTTGGNLVPDALGTKLHRWLLLHYCYF